MVNQVRVYEIDCSNDKFCYIGQTKRAMKTSIKKHFSNLKQPVTIPSVLTRFASLNNGSIAWKNVKMSK